MNDFFITYDPAKGGFNFDDVLDEIKEDSARQWAMTAKMQAPAPIPVTKRSNDDPGDEQPDDSIELDLDEEVHALLDSLDRRNAELEKVYSQAPTCICGIGSSGVPHSVECFKRRSKA